MRTAYIGFFVFQSMTLAHLNLFAQQDVREGIDIHLNSTFFLTGENIYFKIFCHSGSNEPSEISKIAYVEIISPELKPIFRTKVFLDSGEANGYFFIPSSITTANYVMLAYTQWMRNFGSISSVEIKIINPFVNGTSQLHASSKPFIKRTATDSASSDLLIKVLDHYHTRDSVSILLDNPDSMKHYRLSASVMIASTDSHNNFTTSVIPSEVDGSMQVKFLPDLRGDVISGRVLNKTNGHPLVHGNVSVSGGGENYLFLVSRTDSLGYFYCSMGARNCTDTELTIQVLDVAAANYELQMNDKFLNDYTSFQPPAFEIDSHLRTEISKRSVFNQIENAYFNVKKDSIDVTPCGERFYGHADKTYDLEKYTRFPTVEDILRELIPEIVVGLKDKKLEMKVRDSKNKGAIFAGKPLVLLDGRPIVDPSQMTSYDAMKLRRIEVITRRFFYSAFEADGIISFESYDGNASGIELAGSLKYTYESIQKNKFIYSPIYKAAGNNSRIPDYRVQLYWNPKIRVSSSASLLFFTSDIEADFLIEIWGLRSDGKGFFFKKRITVRD